MVGLGGRASSSRAAATPMRQCERGTEVPALRYRNTNFTRSVLMLKSISISGLVLLASLSIAAAQQTADRPIRRDQSDRRRAVQVAAGRQGRARLASRSGATNTDGLRRRQARRAGRARRQPDRPVQGLGAQCTARCDSDHGAAARADGRAEAEDSGEREVAAVDPDQRETGRPVAADDGSGGASRRPEAGHSHDERHRHHPHQRQDPAGARAQYGGDRRNSGRSNPGRLEKKPARPSAPAFSLRDARRLRE